MISNQKKVIKFGYSIQNTKEDWVRSYNMIRKELTLLLKNLMMFSLKFIKSPNAKPNVITQLYTHNLPCSGASIYIKKLHRICSAWRREQFCEKWTINHISPVIYRGKTCTIMLLFINSTWRHNLGDLKENTE